MSSRLRSSMRITSAPKSASSRVATAPTTIQQKSVTRTPASGPAAGPGQAGRIGGNKCHGAPTSSDPQGGESCRQSES